MGSAAFAQDGIERLPTKSINNPVVDVNPTDNQAATSLLDLGGGNLVAAFTDMGSLTVGDTKHRNGFAWSKNGGKSWTDVGALPDSTFGDHFPAILAYGEKAKRVYLATLQTISSEVSVYRSDNKGHSFGPPVTASVNTGATQYGPHIAVDNFKGGGNGNVYVCWSDDSVGGIYRVFLTRSTDNGATFGPIGAQPVTPKGFGCNIAIGPKHEVYLFYYAGDDVSGLGGDNKIFMRRSLNRGATFGPQIMVADLNITSEVGSLNLNGSILSNSFPRAAVNSGKNGPGKKGSQVYVVYNDDPTPANLDDDNGDIFLAMSNNRGQSWSKPKRVNDDKAGEQYEPSIAFDENGKLMIGYYSRSHDMTENLFYHRRGRLGELKGKKGKKYTLNKSFQMSANSPAILANQWVGPQGHEAFYDHIAASGSTFTSGFSATRNGGAIRKYQTDVFAAQINSMPEATDLQVGIVKAPKKIKLGQKGTFKIEVSSTGGQVDDAFVAIPRLPGLNFTKVKGRNCTLMGDFADCNLGKLKDGKTKTVKLTAYAAYKPDDKLKALGTTSSKDKKNKNNKDKAKLKIASGGAVTQTVSSGNIAAAIPANNSVDVPLMLPAGGPMAYAMARVRLDHTDVEYLTLSLISPGGKEIILAQRSGFSGSDFGTGANDCSGTPTVFDDRAATSLYNSDRPFAGPHRPQDLLSDVAGLPSTGTWKLRVTNEDTTLGTIGCVSLTATRQP